MFWKPPTTTLTAPGKPVIIPKVSPDHIDWELELCIVIGKRARHVREAVPNAQHVVLRSGHVPQIEAPRELHAAIARFLGV